MRATSLPQLISGVVASVASMSASDVSLGAGRWKHGWDTTASSTFADFNSDCLLTDAQAHFVAAK